jgi:protein-S-isoprenylcysteine O-methyltransferase Ste14
MLRLPRRLMTIVSALFIFLIYCVIPYWISLSSRRHGWQDGRPGLLNYVGLIAVIGSVAIVTWVLRQHSESIPQEGAKVGNPFEGPGYVITTGAYGYCRHPMHIATIAVWFGWAVFYGSVQVAIAASVILLLIAALVPTEERGIEAKLGDEYRQYKARVPRWPWQSPG